MIHSYNPFNTLNFILPLKYPQSLPSGFTIALLKCRLQIHLKPYIFTHKKTVFMIFKSIIQKVCFNARQAKTFQTTRYLFGTNSRFNGFWSLISVNKSQILMICSPKSQKEWLFHVSDCNNNLIRFRKMFISTVGKN
jgi:hypothetical protein